MAKSIKRRLTLAGIERFTLPDDRNEVVVWDTVAHHLGVRHRRGRTPAFIFTAKFAGRTVRLSLGSVSAITLEQARKETARLNALLAQGIDPREQRHRQKEDEEARRAERLRREARLEVLWEEYLNERKPKWSKWTIRDHLAAAKTGGVLHPLMRTPISELTPQRVGDLFRKEAARRKTTAGRAFRLLRACLNWADDSEYWAGLVDVRRVLKAASAHIDLSPPARVGDVLQTDQLEPWFRGLAAIGHPVIEAYLAILLLTGRRPSEIRTLTWSAVDLRWRTMKIEGKRGTEILPLSPWVLRRLETMPRNGRFIFTTTGKSPIASPARAHQRALDAVGLPHLTLHGLRRTYGTLAELVPIPAGAVAQLQGHAPSALAERHYRRRSLDSLREWASKYERWILNQAGLVQPEEDGRHLEIVR